MRKKRSPVRARRSFAELFFPRVPQRVVDRRRRIAKQQRDSVKGKGSATASNKAYVRWLAKESMLNNANVQALGYSGKSRMWQNPYARPRPRAALEKASVWYTAYPISMITGEEKSALAALGDDALWEVFESIGIQGLHTGPMKRAGGLRGWAHTPSVDGHFDRISNRIDPVFGDEKEFRSLCQVAARHNGIIIDDIVPGHTGKGPDFRLAEMGYSEYPGIYHMVEIEKKDWHLLPDVPSGRDSANIDPKTEDRLKQDGYIIGRLQRVIFYEPGLKETNWSVTPPIKGVDGVSRRWVYLHYFKEGQPSINWLDPSFAGVKLVVGDALHSIGDLGTTGLRLDANGFLGIERGSADAPAWSEGHPLSVAANQLVAEMVRKIGGFTFQELNLSIDDIRAMSLDGADLSYDFITRPACQHALAVADTEFLRLTLRLTLEHGIDPASLVHALQNHDELTYELVHFWTAHKDDEFAFRGKQVTGLDLRQTIQQELRAAVTGKNTPYNRLFTENGIACTTASFVAASLGYPDLEKLTEADTEKIKNAHLLLAMFNAWQPGVFALSGWDLSGALTLPGDAVAELIADGDTRWINRGAYDLLGNQPDALRARSGIAKAPNLYAPLPTQLADEDSFASHLKQILNIRREYGIASARQIDIPDVSHKSLLVMVHELPAQIGHRQITVLNFSEEEVNGTVNSLHLPAAASVLKMPDGEEVAVVDDLHNFTIAMGPFSGASLLVSSPN